MPKRACREQRTRRPSWTTRESTIRCLRAPALRPFRRGAEASDGSFAPCERPASERSRHSHRRLRRLPHCRRSGTEAEASALDAMQPPGCGRPHVRFRVDPTIATAGHRRCPAGPQRRPRARNYGSRQSGNGAFRGGAGADWTCACDVADNQVRPYPSATASWPA